MGFLSRSPMVLHVSGSIFKVKIKGDFYAAVPEPPNHNGHLSPLKDIQLCVFFKLEDYGMILLPDEEELPLRGYFPSQWWQVCPTCSHTFSFLWSLLSWGVAQRAWEWLRELATLRAALWRQHRQDPLPRGGEFSRSPGRVWLLPQRAYMLRKVFMEKP